MFNYSYDEEEWKIIEHQIHRLISEKIFLKLKFIQRRKFKNMVDNISPQLPCSMFVSSIEIENCNLDDWENFDVKFKFPFIKHF